MGGFIGIVLGLTLAAVATNALGYAAKPSVGGIVFSVTFSILIRRILFGYYPANKAAKMNPDRGACGMNKWQKLKNVGL